MASVRCARTLRREGFDGRILLVGDEATPPYNRPPLSKELLRDDLPDDLVLAEPQRWYERRAIDLLAGVRVACVGDVMLDRYWSGLTQRISPEAPVPVVRRFENGFDVFAVLGF